MVVPKKLFGRFIKFTHRTATEVNMRFQALAMPEMVTSHVPLCQDQMDERYMEKKNEEKPLRTDLKKVGRI